MRRIILAIALLLLGFDVVAQTATPQTREEQKLLTTLYYEFNQIQPTTTELAKLDVVIEMLKSDATIKVQIEGYGDPLGGEAVNERVSQSRAQRVADYLLKRNIAESQISFVGCGIDTSAESDAKARKVDVSQIITVVIETTPSSEDQKRAEAEAKRKAEAERRKAEQDRIEAQKAMEAAEAKAKADAEAKAQADAEAAALAAQSNFSLRTNLLYWLVGNINLGAEWNPNKTKLGILINGGYSPFANTEWNHNLGSWFIAPEVRYYLGEREAWFVGAQFLAGGYNIKLSDTGRIGTVIGGGVTGGYKLTLSDNFDMDFSLGLGYGKLNYDTYYKHDNGTNVYIDKDVTKNTFMPVQLGVSLIFKL